MNLLCNSCPSSNARSTAAAAAAICEGGSEARLLVQLLPSWQPHNVKCRQSLGPCVLEGAGMKSRQGGHGVGLSFVG